MSHASPLSKPSNPNNPRVFFDVDVGGERGAGGRRGGGVATRVRRLEGGAGSGMAAPHRTFVQKECLRPSLRARRLWAEPEQIAVNDEDLFHGTGAEQRAGGGGRVFV